MLFFWTFYSSKKPEKIYSAVSNIIIIIIIINVFWSEVKCVKCDVTYGQVWWPILGIRALHLTHPKCTHTAVNTHTPWTHTRSSGQPFMLRHPGSSWGFGALLKGTSVVVLRVKRVLVIHSPHLLFLPARDSNSQPLDYESESLTIRPRLPPQIRKFPPQFWAANQNIRMISEESCDWSIDEITGINYILKYIQIENSYFKQ